MNVVFVQLFVTERVFGIGYLRIVEYLLYVYIYIFFYSYYVFFTEVIFQYSRFKLKPRGAKEICLKHSPK